MQPTTLQRTSLAETKEAFPCLTRLLGLVLVLATLLLTSCYSTKRSVKNGQPYASQIHWPAGYELSETQFYLHNQVDIEASPETVWNILIRAEEWPEWYEGMTDVSVTDSSEGILAQGSRMTFNTMKREFEATVTEFAPYERLGWESLNPKLNAYHAWLILPTSTGCRVITDESQNGRLAGLQKVFRPRKLKRLHDVWLAELKEKAEAAPQ